MMTPGGAASRADQQAALARILYDKATSDEVGRLLENLRPYEESLPYESDDASLIRVARHDYEKMRRVPADLRVAIARQGSVASNAWIEARKKADFQLFLPHLEKNVELKHRYIACFPEKELAYDVLLDDFEQGMTTPEVKVIFDDLKKDLIPLIAAVSEKQDTISTDCLYGHFPVDQQRAFILDILERFGFSPDSWRLDPTVHPFSTGTAPTDIRITTRYYEDFMSSGSVRQHARVWSWAV